MPTRKNKNSTNKEPDNPVSDAQTNTPIILTQERGEKQHTTTHTEDNKQRGGNPQTINIGTIPKIDVIEGKEANEIARTANRISKFAIAVSTLLFIATLLVFYQTVRQTNAAIIAADAAKTSADLQKKSLDSQISAKKQSDIADAKKLKRDNDFIKKQEQGIDAQVASVKLADSIFNKQNEPFLNADNFINFIFKDGIPPYFDFFVYANSNRPIKGIDETFKLQYIFKKDSAIFMKTCFDEMPKPRQTAEYYTQRGQLRIVNDNTMMPFGNVAAIEYGNIELFVIGKIRYVNYITNRIRTYKFVVRFFINKGKITYEPIINDNRDF